MKINNIPERLKQHKYWCVWKDKKMPYNPKTNEPAKTNSHETFADFDTACKAYESGKYSGLGIGIFDGISAIDIDHCIENGELSDMAKDIINQMNSYTEISPSGNGIRIIFTTENFSYDNNTYYINNHNKGLEVYVSNCTSKYVTITGNAINNKPIIDGTSVLPNILNTYMKKKQKSANIPSTSQKASCTSTDIDFLQIGLAKDDKLISYWRGDRPKQSESENDLGFMSKLLFWCNKNEDLALSAFFSSPYVNQKDDSHKKKLERKDYIMSLINNGMPISTAAEKHEEYLRTHSNAKKEKSKATNAKQPKKLSVISAKELQATDYPPVRYLVEDILPEGTSLLSASPKMGKSWFVLDMGLQIASGNMFLNKATTKTGVLYLALEDGYSRLQDRMNKVLNNQPAPDSFHFCITAPTIDNNLLDCIEEHIKEHPDIKLIIIDTLQKIRRASRSSGSMYQQDYLELGTLKTFMDKHKLSLMLVHHNRKLKDPENKFNMISGTNGIMGVADTIFVIDKETREDQKAILNITGRDVLETNTAIRFDTNSCRWEVLGDAKVIDQEERYKRYINSPIVTAIKTLLKESLQSSWKGTATNLIKEAERITKVPIDIPAKNLGSLLQKELHYDLLKYDKIIHKATSNGNAGKVHHFYYAPLFENSKMPTIDISQLSDTDDEEDDDIVEF